MGICRSCVFSGRLNFKISNNVLKIIYGGAITNHHFFMRSLILVCSKLETVNCIFFSKIVRTYCEKWYFVTILVLTYCEKNLLQCNFEFFQGTEAKKSESQKHYKFLAFGLKFEKLFLDSLFLASVPWKNLKLHQNKFFSQQVRTIMVTKYHISKILRKILCHKW